MSPGRTPTPAFGVTSKSSGVIPMEIERRLPGANDVAIDIEFCGVTVTLAGRQRRG